MTRIEYTLDWDGVFHECVGIKKKKISKSIHLFGNDTSAYTVNFQITYNVFNSVLDQVSLLINESAVLQMKRHPVTNIVSLLKEGRVIGSLSEKKISFFKKTNRMQFCDSCYIDINLNLNSRVLYVNKLEITKKLDFDFRKRKIYLDALDSYKEVQLITAFWLYSLASLKYES